MRKPFILLAFALSGCASGDPTYQHVSGPASQFEVDKAACNGEAEKANMTVGKDRALMTNVFGMSREMRAVYDGCMAQRGYLRRD